ncbi:hypothetical protein [Devosia chinhatensis]|uniref:Uncharacterized protein n=1 Tax=Devosia chinhatensis TaxID=429727 RepID=A0A0F5FMW5_9HYPH|nr:hypothetical protein [Devosia chinhatensis]KKB10153.1 hypothetical protein VE26_10340 [Devosia chinhatensis]
MQKILAWTSIAILSMTIGYLAHVIQTESLDIKLLSGNQWQISYPDLITIILTAFGVIIAVASIGLATAAVIGWNSIEGKAMRTASEVLSKDIDDADGKLQMLVKAAIADTSSPFHRTLKDEIQKLMEKEMYRGIGSFESTTNN